MLERKPSKEVPNSPETEVAMSHFAALYPRLLIGGEFLNPDKRDLNPLNKEALGNFNQRDYSIFQYGSARDRMSYWAQFSNLDNQAKYKRWSQHCVATFSNSKNFFTNTEKGKSWSSLFSKLNIDTKNFTPETAAAFYQRYFTGEQNKTGVKQFVSDILNIHTKDNKLDSDALERNLPAINWLANIFGNSSSEVITQLTSAEGKLITSPDSLINEANLKKSDGKLRINELNQDEDRILRFLWSSLPQGETNQPTTTPNQNQEELKLTYERPGDPRVFPGKINPDTLLNPEKTSKDLKRKFPELYGNIPDEELKAQVGTEQKMFEQWRQQTGLDNDYLREMLIQNLNSYGHFLENKYKIKIPKIGYIQIVPLFGKTADAFMSRRGALAFTMPKHSAIFLDFDVIYAHADHLRRTEHKQATGRELLGEMPRGKVRSFIMRLLREIQPHEYTHLIGDIAFWKLSAKTSDSEKILDYIPGKVGLDVIKPELVKVKNDLTLTLLDRGTPLTEAVTVELTEQWAKSFGAKLDLPVYENERKMLDSIINLLSREFGISKDKSFHKIVEGYFTPEGFRNLIKDLSGREKATDGIKYKRPHFLQIVYALADAEIISATRSKATPDYSLTLAYIENSNNLGKLNNEQKSKIADIIKFSKRTSSPIQLSNRAIKYLVTQLNLDPSLK